MIERATAAALIVKENTFVDETPLAVTWTVKLEVAAVVGVPPRTPVEEFRVRPAGSDPPDTVQVLVPVPPVAANVWLYAVPTVPAGNGLAVVIERATAAALIVKENTFVDETPLAVTWTVKLEVAAVVGVPPRTPVEEFRVRPAGSDPPDTVQVLVPVPPVAANVWPYAVPTVPAGNELAVVIERAAAAALIVKENTFVDETPLAVTWTVKLEVAAVVGVPPRTPVEEFRVRPAGSDPPDTVQVLVPVPPVAANVWLYAVPTVPAGNGLAVVIERATAAALIVKENTFVDDARRWRSPGP